MKRHLAMAAGGAAACALLVAMPGEAPAQEETFQLTMQATWPTGDPHYFNFTRWAEEVERMTRGRVQIETLPAGAIVPAFEVLDSVHDGVLDGGHAWSGYWIGKDRAAVMVSSGPAGPFGMNAVDYWGWIWEGGGLEVNNRFFQETLDSDVVWFPAGSTGPQSLGWFNVEITSAEDFRGQRLRIPGIPGEMYEAMGLSVITLPGGEIVPAGERGVIDAAEYVGPWIDEAMGFEDVWQYHYAPAYHEVVTVAEVLFNKDIWDSFPEDIQDLITLVTREHHIWFENVKYYNNKEAMDRLTEKGVQFLRTPGEILEQSLDAWHDIFANEYETNEAFRMIANSQLEWARNVVVAKRILEPDWKALADVYWAPGGIVETMDLDVEYEAPPYYFVFSEPTD
jgi:TRAP-type mannitol/chloroaromatic compound transport system substrate-binding protein